MLLEPCSEGIWHASWPSLHLRDKLSLCSMVPPTPGPLQAQVLLAAFYNNTVIYITCTVRPLSDIV